MTAYIQSTTDENGTNHEKNDLPDPLAEEAEMMDTLGRLLSQHKLVPFVGAGVSRQHLGFAGGELAVDMAKILGEPSDTTLSRLADRYVEVKGEQGFADYLKARLTVDVLDEAKVPVHGLILSLSSRVIYTTNQDNLFELTASHYGRPYKRVVTLKDLSDAIPGEPMLIKFHGDPQIPKSLVFGQTSYERRIAEQDHPLDIRLKSDLLGKQLLFLGYSLRDENIHKLLEFIKKVFSGVMPPSYLVAFEYDSSMVALASTYGVKVIDPASFTDEAVSAAEAFERVLKMICNSTIEHQSARGLEMLFDEEKINSRMVTKFELTALAKVIDTGSFEVAISTFRGLLDDTVIPAYLVERSVQMFRKVTELANPKIAGELEALKGMLFNFRAPPSSAAEAMAYVMVACNQRPSRRGYDDFASLVCPAIADGFQPVAAALAVEILCERQEIISDQFRELARSWFAGYEEVHVTVLDQVKLSIAKAWPGVHAARSPLAMPQFHSKPKGFHSIVNDLQESFPKKFRIPEE